MFNYRVEWHNIEKNKWELYGTGRTLDEAFDIACTAVGASKIHDDICIMDRDDTVLWDSNGFRQGKGLSLPLLSDCEFDQKIVAKDGSC